MVTDRMMRAAQLDGSLFREVKSDPGATAEALIVVVAAALASGIANGIGLTMAGHPGQAVGGIIGGVVSGIIMWAVWSVVIYFIGTMVFGGKASVVETMRAIGYAYTPNVLLILGFLPLVGGLVRLVAGIWVLVTGVVAIREAMDLDTAKAVLTGVLGIVSMLIVGMLLAVLGLGMAFLT